VALTVYAGAFSFAYLELDAGSGALILFGAVQFTMILVGWISGERPRPLAWGGFLVAIVGLVYLVSPGLSAPAPFGSFLMVLAGAAWGAYSLLGRGAVDPVAVTTDNFTRSLLLAAPAGTLLCFFVRVQVTPTGFALAVVSGALTSGLGYVVWYAALAGLSATRAGMVQLTVPVMASIGGVFLLDEALTGRLVLASLVILGGMGLTVLASDRSKDGSVGAGEPATPNVAGAASVLEGTTVVDGRDGESRQTYWQRIEGIVGPTHAAEFGEIGQAPTRQAFESFLLSGSDRNTRLLDAGCNTGVEGCRLFEAGFQGTYVGVDNNWKALHHARHNLGGHRAHCVQAAITNLPCTGRVFDFTLSKDVIEHLEDYRACVGELCRVSARYLILSFFIKPKPRPAEIFQHRHGYFLNRYDRRELFAFIEEQGFVFSQSLFEDRDDEVLVWKRRPPPVAEADRVVQG